MKNFVCIVFLAVIHQVLCAGTWSYSGADGPSHWWEVSGTCNGTRQSPINIVRSEVVTTDLGLFELNDYSSENMNMDMDNNGHGVTVRLAEEDGYLYNLTGGGLPKMYVATQFHLHWGSNNNQGSEHTIDNGKYPAELHMVHYDPSFPDLVAALTSGQWDAVTVLGAWITVGDYDNPDFNRFLNYLDGVKNYTSPKSALGKGNLPSFSIRSVLPFDLSEFYRYNGSLTVPNCYETVIWTVFKNTVEISQSQLDLLRSMLGDETDQSGNALPIVDNYRPPQPIYERTVYFSTPGGASTPPSNLAQTTESTGGSTVLSPTKAISLIAFALAYSLSVFY